MQTLTPRAAVGAPDPAWHGFQTISRGSSCFAQRKPRAATRGVCSGPRRAVSLDSSVWVWLWREQVRRWHGTRRRSGPTLCVVQKLGTDQVRRQFALSGPLWTLLDLERAWIWLCCCGSSPKVTQRSSWRWLVTIEIRRMRFKARIGGANPRTRPTVDGS
jgi:hypothetical protein